MTLQRAGALLVAAALVVALFGWPWVDLDGWDAVAADFVIVGMFGLAWLIVRAMGVLMDWWDEQ